MNAKLQFRSVKTRQAFWFLVVAIVPMVTMVAILYFQRAEGIRGREFEKLQTVRDLKVREINSWLDKRLRDLAVAAGNDEIRGLEEVFAKTDAERTEEDLNAIAVARAHLQRYVDHYDSYHELFLVSASHHVVEISSIKSREGRDMSEAPHFNATMRKKGVHVTPIYHSKTEHRPAMSVSIPLYCRKHDGQHLFAVLVARIDLHHSLYPLLQEHTGSGKTGESVVVNEDGYALNELRWHDNAPLRLKIAAEAATRAAAGETGIVETLDYRDEMVLAAYTHIPRTGWGFVAKRDLAAVHEPIHAMVWDMAVLLAASAAAVLLAALLLSRAISRSVLEISETVQRVAAGDLKARYGGKGADEIAALGTSFNAMADSLASQMAILQGGSEVSETMVAAADVKSFASGLLMKLLEVTGSHIGAFYMRSEDGRTFAHVASVGLAAEAVPSFSAEICEGELGGALATKRIAFIEDIPENTVFAFKTTAGTAIPREIVTIPLLVEEEVAAIVSLATLVGFSRDHREILDQALIGMDIAFSNLLAHERSERMARELRVTNGELAILNEELQSQSEELQDQADELEAQRAQLDDANRLKSQFLSNMSHELRTPLNSVMALSQLMLSRGPGKKPEQDAEYLQVIERNGRHLLNLINKLLDLSKIEAGRMEAIVTEFDPRQVVDRALETARLLAEEKHLPIRVDVRDVPGMCSDEEKVYQILLNLLSNAVKFTEQGEIEVTVQAADEQVSFAVRDTGAGIAEDDLENVFDEFRQVDGSTTRKHGGTGLGLSIGRKLARLLGGEITVQSTPDEGSTFTLTLPVQCPAEAQAARPAPVANGTSAAEPSARARPASPDSRRPLVLVVEDNEVAAVQIRSILEESGYLVTVATGGGRALESVKHLVPDAIVLDLMMPQIDGFQVLEQIRSDEQTAAVPVLVLTSKELTAEDHARLALNNIQESVQKGSVNRDQLLKHVDELLGRPSAPAAAEPSGPPAERAPPAKPSSGGIVLVVEDNADNLLAIGAILDELGLEYVAAEDGRQAVKLAKQHRPGLILMDIELPKLSGLDAVKQIKADPALGDVLIVAVTARAMKGAREAILAAGFDDYLSKPLDPEDLTAVIRKWIS